ncbi:unnamed protein product [Paramecium sonneborni]|uniref:Uncharacterized protein n=1 Tax=Paramecium sonneborni TaxID=65129 RepID=A0A8S1NYG6_9CILI|nr:unnamed protein product [Paramecium sonneborni]
MNTQKNTQNNNDHNRESNFEMEDLKVVSHEIAIKEFYHFIEKTSFIQENFEMLSKVGENLRLNFKDWPTDEQAIMLFKLNIQNERRKSIKWSEPEKKLFCWIVIRYCLYKGLKDNRLLKQEDWREISKIVIGRNAHQLRQKWEQKYLVPLSQIPWTKQEDQLLFQVHEDFKKLGRENKWSQIANEMFQRSSNKVFRQPKQYRERWINRLDPNISNEPWDKQQEINLLKMILIRGKRWSELSIIYGKSRTENSLKNRYNSLIKKQISKQEIDSINPILFEKVQILRQNYSKQLGLITPIEEIDNYECQFILLAIKSLYVELYLQQGNIAEAEKINNDESFDYFQEQFIQEKERQIQNFYYKKKLNLQKVDSKFQIENDKSSIVIFNQRKNKIYLTPYNIQDFQEIILNKIIKKVNIDFSDNQYDQEKTSLSNQSGLFLANQQNLLIPSQQLNNYWFIPNYYGSSLSAQTSNSIQFHTLKQSQQYQKSIDQKNQSDIIAQIGVDIKTVDSCDEI